MSDYDENNKVTLFPRRDSVDREAAEWVTLRSRRDLTAEEEAAFTEWKNADPKHEQALNEAEAVWAQLDRLAELKNLALPPEPHVDVPAPYEQSALKLPFTRRSGMAAMAASAALVVFGAVGVQTYHAWSSNQHDTFKTALGERKTVKMADGSSAILNTNSILEVDYTRQARTVRLKSGEAYFTVAHNSKRPFNVVAGNDVVRAVGTAFSVYMENDATQVTVTEGRVALLAQETRTDNAGSAKKAANASVSAPIAEISAGYNATLRKTKAPKIVPISSAELERKLSWRDGLVSFAGMPLTDAVSQITRYADYKIEIVDPSIKALPIGGSFRVGDVDEFLLALEGAFDIQVEHVTRNHVRLRRAV